MRIKSRKYKNIDRIIRLCCITGALFAYSSTAYATIAVDHNRLPVGGKFVYSATDNVVADIIHTKTGDSIIHTVGNSGTNVVTGTIDTIGSVMNVVQPGANAVIKWQDFSIGTNATVNFKEANNGNFNVLNYVDSGVISQIYGNLNATNGNVFLVNTAGALISKSAEINVGSLYVSNQKLENLNTINGESSINDFVATGTVTSAELMNLGHIKANHVTFVGDRVVLDSEYLKKANGEKLGVAEIIVTTDNINNVVIGYDAYDETNQYIGKNTNTVIATVNGVDFTKKQAYMWVEDVNQLQAIETNKDGNYALRNSIDAIATKDWTSDVNTNTPANFVAIGTEASPFKGKFDGLDNNVFGLTVTKNKNKTNSNVGLFGVAQNAIIRNVDMIAGSVTGTQNVGSIVGKAIGGEISNITTSMEVRGSASDSSKIGGIVGATEVYEYEDKDKNKHFVGTKLSQLDNVGTVQGFTKVGGIVGEMVGGELNGGSFNMGYVKGVNTAVTTDTDTDTGNQSNDIGGLVGYAQNAILGKENEEAIANKMEVSGGYNVGGIVGRYEYDDSINDGNTGNDIIINAVNSGDITATGYVGEEYKYHTDFDGIEGKLTYSDVDSNGLVTISNVLISNVGGVVGNILSQDSTVNIYDVANTGNVQTTLASGKDYYYGGNVGGVVGRADGINITKATNDENEIRGGHNVGGIVGYIETGSINDTANTGDIMGTGAYGGTLSGSQITDISGRRQIIRSDYSNSNKEDNIIGNIGGVAGYMYGDNVQLNNSGNRGNVHTMYIDTEEEVSVASQAANLGGVVGKMDGTNNTESYINTAYNTGDVDGYLNIGGIIGQIYNGLIQHSHNLGNIKTTRPHAHAIATTTGPINMGGIVGDATEMGNARAYINDVYNKGKIGNEDYSHHGRHVGGIVGRLSGYISNAYNTGDIFMGNNVVGGIVGYWYAGNIDNVFNTGNITVSNRSTEKSQVGGLIGAVDIGPESHNLSYAYNLGTVRSFKSSTGTNTVGGIVGEVQNYAGNKNSQLIIDNVYTLSHLYEEGSTLGINPMYGLDSAGNRNTKKGEPVAIVVTNSYHILPSVNDVYSSFTSGNQGSKSIAFNDRDKRYKTDSNGNDIEVYDDFQFVTVGKDSDSHPDGTISGDGHWRMYEGTMPILNVFMPDTKNYFAQSDKRTNISSVQYGNAYDPYLTIINASDNLEFDWLAINSYNDTNKNVGDHTSLIVHGAGLTLNNFNLDNKMFGGILYSDGDLYINNTKPNGAVGGQNDEINDIKIGSCADIYGSTISIDSNDKDLIIYGNVEATAIKSSSNILPDGSVFVPESDESTSSELGTSVGVASGSVVLNGNNVEIIGAIRAATKDADIKISGIANGLQAIGDYPFGTAIKVEDKYEHVTHLGDLHVYPVPTVDGSNITYEESKATGDVIIKAKNNADVLLGVGKQGIITAPGNLNITATSGDVYIDSDIDLGTVGSVKVTSPGEIVFDMSNIGKVQGKNIDVAVSDFVGLFDSNINNPTKKLIFSSGKTGVNANAIIAFDMWDSTNNKFDANLYGGSLAGSLNALKVSIDNDSNATNDVTAMSLSHLWISDAKQLDYLDNIDSLSVGGEYNQNQINKIKNLLESNFALKNDINANDLIGFRGIGGEAASTGNSSDHYVGTFNGRGYSIVGLNIDTAGVATGLVNILGTKLDNKGQVVKTGTVKNLNIYSSTFKGGSVGAVAGVNNGKIENVYTFGNHIESEDGIEFGSSGSKFGAAGGVAGFNTGDIVDADNNNIVIAGNVSTGSYHSVAGGITGYNSKTINYSLSDSAITASLAANSLGGIAGVSSGTGAIINGVESYGVVNGKYIIDSNASAHSDDVGGIVGTLLNGASINGAYNDSEIIGVNSVGGIVGYSGYGSADAPAEGSSPVNNIKNVINGGSISGADYVGGLLGHSEHTKLDGARNAGEITGEDYVGGIVGQNTETSELHDIVNDNKASITGIRYVGGVAGQNSGVISAEQMGLQNKGELYGKQYVGGIVGHNTSSGQVVNTINDIELYVNPNNIYYSGDLDNSYSYAETGTQMDAKYFGGVVGKNEGIITNAENKGEVNANGASYVGGIVGHNTNTGILAGAGNANSGNVIGSSYVGGVGGKNDIAINGTEDEMVIIVNRGSVNATAGGAGGIWGENTGNFTHVEMRNEGIVNGASDNDSTSGTGGIIGTNSGTITKSTLINTATATVEGKSLVGGLIGINSGSITGGRDEGDNYYKYHISNNGNIVGTGNNVGGLIGRNENAGKITAAYNTGAVTGKENVGGIVGSNAGEVDQVFSVSAKTGNVDNKITGKDNDSSNIGGLIGYNSGKLTDSYNSSVMGTTGTNIGNAVGSNAGTINNVYATNNSGKLIGVGSDWRETSTQDNAQNNTQSEPKVTNVYSYVADDDSAKVIGSNDRNNIVSYKGFYALSGEETNQIITVNNEWKAYDGQTNPLLKVFLTKASFSTANEFEGFTYDARTQSLVIKPNGNVVEVHLVSKLGDEQKDSKIIGSIVVNDPDALHSLVDFIDTYKGDEDSIANLLNSVLVKNNDNVITQAGDTFKIYSQQINTTEAGNHNNLGYDIDYSATVQKATVDLSLNDIYRTYGDGQIYSNEERTASGSYADAYTLSGVNGDMQTELAGNVKIEVAAGDDLAVAGCSGDKKTNNADDYNWTATATLENTNDNTGITSNYQFAGGSVSKTVTGNDKSHVAKAELVVSLKEVIRIYGQEDLKQGYKYGVSVADNAWANGDKVNASDLIQNIHVSESEAKASDGALDHDDANRVTEDVNAADTPYAWGFAEGKVVDGMITTSGSVNQNYNIKVNAAGDSNIEKANLKITIDSASTVYGTAFAGETANGGYTYSFGEINGGETVNDLVNNDADGVVRAEILDKVGAVVNDAAISGEGEKVTKDVGEYAGAIHFKESFDADGNALTNYNVEVINGTANITKAQLTLTLDDVYRVYGDATMYSEADCAEVNKINDYAYTVSGWTNDDSKNAANLLNSVTLNVTDGAVSVPSGSGKTTNNVKAANEWYTLSGTAADSAVGDDNKPLAGSVGKNYEIVVDGSAAKSIVEKANLKVTIGNASTEYGTAFDVSQYGYTITGNANGDTDDIIRNLIDNVTYSNTGAGTGGKATGNVGDYELSFASGVTLDNYNVTVTKGIAKVTPATLNVIANNSSVNYGDKPTYSGTVTGFENGDTAQSLGYEQFNVTNPSLEGTSGTHANVIGLVVDSNVVVSDVTIGNYQLDVTPGTLTVADQFIIDDPMEEKHKIWYAEDRYAWYMWDKNRNERERKAEVYFVDGATKL